jgi:hypothetical protein
MAWIYWASASPAVRPAGKTSKRSRERRPSVLAAERWDAQHARPAVDGGARRARRKFFPAHGLKTEGTSVLPCGNDTSESAFDLNQRF